MKSVITGLALAVASHFALAQKSPIKFGEIPMSDMTMTVYPEDTSAVAVILADYGDARIELIGDGAQMVVDRHVRIKILKSDGLSWGDVKIPLYHIGSREEKVTNVKGVTYNLENGKIVESKMLKVANLKEKFSRNYYIQKFALPNVKPGSVLEFSYVLRSEFYTNFPNWKFQYEIPVRWSEYWAFIPTVFRYEKYLKGYLPVSSYEVKQKTSNGIDANAHHWVMEKVPAFKEEPYLTCEEDYISQMSFSLTHYSAPGHIEQELRSWRKLNEELIESPSFGGIIKSSSFLRKQVEEITAGLTDPMQKAKAIYDYVKQNIEWNGVEDYEAESPKKIFEVKKGTVGDINIMLASMLDKADIPVDMVLLSTRDHGFVRTQHPNEHQFNYAIVQAHIGDKTMLLDATNRYLPMHVLPERCVNGSGLVISKTNHGWIKLESKTKTRTVITTDMTLNDNGEMTGSLNFLRDGYAAGNMRSRYFKKGEEKYLQDFLGTKSWGVDKTEFLNLKEIEQAAKENHKVKLTEHISTSGDLMYLNPFIVMEIESNPFKLEERVYPVDFGSPQEIVYSGKFILPENYVIDEVPPNKMLMLPNNAGKFLYNCALMGNTLTITTSFQINKSLFVQDEYPHLREFYNQVIAKQSEQIVLKKK